MNSEFKPLADALYRERVLRARQMAPEERLLEGVRMFDRECEATLGKILKANPSFSQKECLAELRRRLREADAENESQFYRPIPVPPFR